ncbi:MAG: hypothetical protein JW715_05950, partial [Sedimentisphaerales bacterium]|nr:hypothetical protein [Sedimentisphaerales bacterium]
SFDSAQDGEPVEPSPACSIGDFSILYRKQNPPSNINGKKVKRKKVKMYLSLLAIPSKSLPFIHSLSGKSILFVIQISCKIDDEYVC